MMDKDESLVYMMTPESAFSPNFARSKTSYTIGSVMPVTECRHREYKTGPYALNNLEEHVRKYGSAFLNSGGGSLMFGVLDNGTVVGITIPRQQIIRDRIKHEFKLFTPSVGDNFYEVDFVPTNIKDKYVIELHVRSGEENEIYADGLNKMFIRRDGSIQGPLWPRHIRKLVLDKLQKQELHQPKKSDK